MARAWRVLRHSWKRSHYACAEKALWTGQVVGLAILLRSPSSVSATQIEAASVFARWNVRGLRSAAAYEVNKRGRQGLWWKSSFQDKTPWWDSRYQKSNARPPDFRHTESGEARWIDKFNKHVWADAQLATLGAQMDHTASVASPSNFLSGHADQHIRLKVVTPEFVKELCQQGQVRRAVECLQVVIGMNSGIDKYLFYHVLRECVARRDLMLGGQVHALAVKTGFGSDTFLSSHFIRMYAGHGKLQEAMDVFTAVPLPDAFMWSSIISAHVKLGHAERAIELYQHMRSSRTKPDGHVLVAALQACAAVRDLPSGKQVYNDVLTSGMEFDKFVCSSLVDMFTKCGSLIDARGVFDRLGEKNVVTWNVMIAGYARVEGMGQEALGLYSAMRYEGAVAPSAVTFVSLLQACANVGVSALETGKQLHSQLRDQRLESDVVVGASLVNMYVKCGSLQDARIVFDSLGQKNVVTWSAMLSGYAHQEGMGQEALSLYSAMHKEGVVAPNAVTFVCLLQACANVGASALETGKQLHSQVINGRLESDVVTGGSLVNMYTKCGSLKDARAVFDRLCEKNVVTWNTMISGYAQKEGMGHEALSLYTAMREECMAVPNAMTFACILQACANLGVSALENGKQIHSQLMDRRLECDVVVGGSLVNMYVKCGSLDDARITFDRLREKNVVSWTSMISGYAEQEGMGQEALRLYSAMCNEGIVAPSAVTVVCLLQACANVGRSALETGMQLHSQLKGQTLEVDAVMGASLVNMYVKCGSLVGARAVFDGLHEKDVVSWTAMIAGYARQEGMGQEALSLYSAMQNEGIVAPDAVTFVCLLEACANVGASALEKGKQLHSQLEERRLESDVVVGSSLVNMYAMCGSLENARFVFDRLGEKNVVTWNSMICGCAQHSSMGQEALNLYSVMHKESMVAPDAVTFVSLLKACANVGLPALEKGKQLHSMLKEQGLESDAVVGGSLVNMYVRCGSLKTARCVFEGLNGKNVVTWTALLAGYAEQEGMGQEALSLYGSMHKEGLVAPDAVTFVCLLKACANVGVAALERGQQLHVQLRERGLDSHVAVGGSLVNMYAKCGSLTDARMVFDRLGEKNVVTWNAMISAYTQQEGMGLEALNIYYAMHSEGLVAPNAVTFVCLLQACASFGALQQGKQLHLDIRERGLEGDIVVGTHLVRMYAKCGRLEASREVFDRLPSKNLVTWTALLKGYAENGEGGMAIHCFEELLEQGLEPDEVTYTCLLKACSHAGLVEQGQRYFETMVERHGVEPDEQHYNCMVDLLGRSGHLGRAEQMLRASGVAGNTVGWTALLSACKSYGDAERGRRCFDQLVNLVPTVAGAYVLLGSIYANGGRWDEVGWVEKLRRAAGARKMAAKACIEVKKEVHEFTVGEERGDVAVTLRAMNTRVKEGGHVPHTQLVLRAASEQEKEDALCGHAEKLALAYGLLNTPPGSPLVVTKNLRMCGDCHSSTKIMSRLEMREIVVRDSHKVHRFQNGACSCQDRP